MLGTRIGVGIGRSLLGRTHEETLPLVPRITRVGDVPFGEQRSTLRGKIMTCPRGTLRPHLPLVLDQKHIG